MEKFLYQDLYNLEEKHWWHKNKRKLIKSLIAKYSQKRNLQILDLGCGTGKNIEELKNFGKVWGIDNSIDAINFCKQRGLKNIFLRSSSSTQFPNNFFDVVLVMDVLEHTNDLKTLMEISRILKKDGLVIISVPAFSWLWSKWDVIHYHKRRYTIKKLSYKLTKYEFSIIKISYVYSFLVIPILLVRLFKTFLKKKNYSSDFQISFPIVNQLFSILCNIERLIILYGYVSLGSSIFCVAKKLHSS